MADTHLTRPGLLRAAFDPQQKLVKVVGQGFCDEHTSDAFLSELRSAVAAQRKMGPVRVLVDGRELVAQATDIVNRMQAETSLLYRSGDRVAVLVSSALFRMQIQRSVADDFRRLFVSEDEARAWLAET